MGSVVDHYANHLGPLYEWMVGDVQAALVRSAAELDALNVNGRAGGTAIDLGAGIGLHALPLARRGYNVIAIDSNQQLLTSLKSRAGELPITTVNADLLDFQIYLRQPADVIVCMGDTLGHLPDVTAVKDLFAAVAGSLNDGGMFVTTFRDYVTTPLTAERRFIPVRSDAQRILTCFLEYTDDIVMVHDVVHEWENGKWTQRVSSYPKLRLAPAWVVSQLQHHGLEVQTSVGTSGMVCVVAKKS